MCEKGSIERTSCARLNVTESVSERCGNVGRDVVVRKHHAFRITGRSGRIDQDRHGRQIARRGVATGIDSRGYTARSAFASNARSEPGIHRLRSNDQRRPISSAVAKPARKQLTSGKDQLGLAVPDDVGDLVERLRREDRHDDEARGERRPVRDEPIDAVRRRRRRDRPASSRCVSRNATARSSIRRLPLGARAASPHAVDALAQTSGARIAEVLADECRQ